MNKNDFTDTHEFPKTKKDSFEDWCKVNNQKLLEEWDYEKNYPILPSHIKPKSNKPRWWVGKCGHEWETSPNHRLNGTGCPYCAGRRALPGFNDLESLNPELAKQWHPTLNGDLKPSDVTLHSNKKVW